MRHGNLPMPYPRSRAVGEQRIAACPIVPAHPDRSPVTAALSPGATLSQLAAGALLGQWRGAITQGAVAAALSHVQLWVPETAGVVVAVSRVLVTATGAMVVSVARSNTALTTAAGTIVDPHSRGHSPAFELRRQTDASALATAVMINHQVAADTLVELLRDGEVVLLPGSGLVVLGNTVNLGIRVSFAARVASSDAMGAPWRW